MDSTERHGRGHGVPMGLRMSVGGVNTSPALRTRSPEVPVIWVLGGIVAHGAGGIALQVVDARGAPRPGVSVRVGRGEPVTTDAFGWVRLPLGPGRHELALSVECWASEVVRVTERTRVRTVRFDR